MNIPEAWEVVVNDGLEGDKLMLAAIDHLILNIIQI